MKPRPTRRRKSGKAEPNKRNLNNLLIARLKPKEERAYLVWDTKQRNLAVRIETSGYRSFKVIYSRNNRPRWYHVGPCDVVDLVEARKKAAQIMAAVLDGRDPAADRRAERTAGTFSELADRYRDEYAKRENKSWEQADALIKKYVLPKWKNLSVGTITRADARSVIRSLADTPILANTVLAAMSAIFSWAIREEIAGLKINPCTGIERYKPSERERVLTDSELPLFWKKFDQAGLEGVALKVILLTGQRPGEVTHMRSEHLSEDGWWDLPGAADRKLSWPGTKNKFSHRVFLTEAVRELIADLSPDGLVFEGVKGVPITGLDKAMRSICSDLGISNKVTPHDLRRSCGTMITRLGFGREAMDRILNHREGRRGVGRIYDRHTYADEDRSIMKAVTSSFMSLIKEKKKGDDNVVAFDRVGKSSA